MSLTALMEKEFESMKPRIFIYMHYLELGGAESALIGLLNAFDPQKVDVDLFLGSIRGPLVSRIPSHIRLLPPMVDYDLVEAPIATVLRRGMWALAWRRLKAKRAFNQYCKSHRPSDHSAIFGYIGHYVTPILSSLKHLGHYDLAISFMHPHNIVLDKVDATKKICWIHTDYSKIDVNIELELPVWNSYDYIASISEDATKQFLTKFPSLSSKILTIDNILSPTIIRKFAEASTQDHSRPLQGTISILTIGRYSPAKRLDAIPLLLKLIRETGIDAHWHIIGYGGSDDYIRQAIEQADMQPYVHILGKKENPYPYIAACDWYVQPSLYEGKSIVVREAQILGKPVIITNYATADSQINDGIDGFIVPMQIEDCAKAISKILSDNDAKQRIVDFLSNNDYGNEGEVQKIYDLL